MAIKPSPNLVCTTGGLNLDEPVSPPASPQEIIGFHPYKTPSRYIFKKIEGTNGEVYPIPSDWLEGAKSITVRNVHGLDGDTDDFVIYMGSDEADTDDWPISPGEYFTFTGPFERETQFSLYSDDGDFLARVVIEKLGVK